MELCIPLVSNINNIIFLHLVILLCFSEHFSFVNTSLVLISSILFCSVLVVCEVDLRIIDQ